MVGLLVGFAVAGLAEGVGAAGFLTTVGFAGYLAVVGFFRGSCYIFLTDSFGIAVRSMIRSLLIGLDGSLNYLGASIFNFLISASLISDSNYSFMCITLARRERLITSFLSDRLAMFGHYSVLLT